MGAGSECRFVWLLFAQVNMLGKSREREYRGLKEGFRIRMVFVWACGRKERALAGFGWACVRKGWTLVGEWDHPSSAPRPGGLEDMRVEFLLKTESGYVYLLCFFFPLCSGAMFFFFFGNG